MPGLTLETPTGTFFLVEEDGAITGSGWGKLCDREEPTALLVEARRQVESYFAGGLKRFDLPLRLRGEALQEAVWREMQAIPYGETRTYGELAGTLGSNARLVGTACGRNAIPIIIPCHRVVGSGGRMVGFSGGQGIETKRALLALEGSLLL